MPTSTFRLGSVLGSGTYSLVFSADEQSSGTVAAIKKSRISLRVKRTMLRHEARVIQLLQGHPAIPRFYGYLRVPHFEYIALELLGPDMKALCKPGHALKFGTVARIAEQMLSALEHLYAHGVVHRDIKPANILLRPSDPCSVTLIDFGMSRKLTAADALPTQRYNPIENNRTVVGTLHWCSVNSHLGYDLRPYDDSESLAYTLIYLFMGDLPWRSYSPKESTKNAMIRILAAKQVFLSPTTPSIIPFPFRELLYFARSTKGDITDGLAVIRKKMHALASLVDESEDEPLDFTPRNALVSSRKLASPSESESGSVDGSDDEPNEEYSNSYWGFDIDCWDMRAARDKSLTFPTDEAELLDGQTPEIAVIDKHIAT